MDFDPEIHHRHSIRLYEYDYSSQGYYFVTICTHNRKCTLGRVAGDRILLSNWGKIAYERWRGIPKHFSYVALDRYVVMPNHLHGILHIQDALFTDEDTNVGAQHAAPNPPNVHQGSLGAIIRSYKSSVTKQVKVIRKTPGARFWQRIYYDRIIRNEKEYMQICEYIGLNLQRWSADKYYTEVSSSST